MALEDILKTINDETERQQLSGLLDKYSPVKVALERGDSMAQAFNELTALGADPLTEARALPEWINWRRNNVDPATSKLKPVMALESERDVLKARVAELEARGETDLTQEEIDARLDARLDSRLKALREDPANPIVDRNSLQSALNAHAKFQENIFATLGEQIITHQTKYNEALPVQEVLDYMIAHKETDPKKAYQAILVPREATLKIKALEAERDKKFEEGKAAGVAEAQARVNARRHPVDGKGTVGGGAGHFMRKIFGARDKRAEVGNTRLGSGFATQAGLADHQKRAMGGGAV